MNSFAPLIAEKLKIRSVQADTVLSLLEEGATIPFIARYRKDRTGALDEVVIQQIQDEFKILKVFTERKTTIEKSVSEQGKMTGTLQKKLNGALTLAELEDIYLPYKPKRKTKAQAAREKGLESLALLILGQKPMNLQQTAEAFVKDEVKTAEEALQGEGILLRRSSTKKNLFVPAYVNFSRRLAGWRAKYYRAGKRKLPNSKTILISPKKFQPSLLTVSLLCCADLWKGFYVWKFLHQKKMRCC